MPAATAHPVTSSLLRGGMSILCVPLSGCSVSKFGESGSKEVDMKISAVSIGASRVLLGKSKCPSLSEIAAISTRG